MEMMYSDCPALLYDVCCDNYFAGYDDPMFHVRLMMEYIACGGLLHRINSWRANCPLPDFLEG